MEEVKLLQSYFEFFYAKEIMSKMYKVFKINCSGCQQGELSQLNHPCLSLTDYEQLELNLDDILDEVNESVILKNWDSAVSVMQNISPELKEMYKLKIYCQDWRDTDMKTTVWKSKMYRLTCELIQLKNNVSTEF
jgi:hypothetical protein